MKVVAGAADREVIRVRRSINRFEGVGLPKNSSSEREVDMRALVVDELQEQRARIQFRGDLVFVNESWRSDRSDELPRSQLETNSREGFSAAPHGLPVPT
jgi:hypothetical protein